MLGGVGGGRTLGTHGPGRKGGRRNRGEKMKYAVAIIDRHGKGELALQGMTLPSALAFAGGFNSSSDASRTAVVGRVLVTHLVTLDGSKCLFFRATDD